MLIAELRLDATQERAVAEDGVDVRRDGGHGDGVALVGDGAVQVGQGLGIIERIRSSLKCA